MRKGEICLALEKTQLQEKAEDQDIKGFLMFMFLSFNVS